jgi:hypothetical protein
VPVEHVRAFTSSLLAENTFFSFSFVVELQPRSSMAMATLAACAIADDINVAEVEVRTFTHRKANGQDQVVHVQKGAPGFPHIAVDPNMSSVTVKGTVADATLDFVLQIFDFN